MTCTQDLCVFERASQAQEYQRTVLASGARTEPLWFVALDSYPSLYGSTVASTATANVSGTGGGGGDGDNDSDGGSDGDSTAGDNGDDAGATADTTESDTAHTGLVDVGTCCASRGEEHSDCDMPLTGVCALVRADAQT